MKELEIVKISAEEIEQEANSVAGTCHCSL